MCEQLTLSRDAVCTLRGIATVNRPSVCLSARLRDCDVDVPWAYVLGFQCFQFTGASTPSLTWNVLGRDIARLTMARTTVRVYQTSIDARSALITSRGVV